MIQQVNLAIKKLIAPIRVATATFSTLSFRKDEKKPPSSQSGTNSHQNSSDQSAQKEPQKNPPQLKLVPSNPEHPKTIALNPKEDSQKIISLFTLMNQHDEAVTRSQGTQGYQHSIRSGSKHSKFKKGTILDHKPE